MKTMKRLVFLLGCSSVLLGGAELATVRSVYILPMSRGLDQYLANRLTNEHTFHVVTDPKLADAVFTDHIGESFEGQMDTLYPPPPPPPPPVTEKPKVETTEIDKSVRKSKHERMEESNRPMITDTVNKLSNPASNFGKAKGTIFLVDAKSHQVVWSVFEPAKGSTNGDLDKTALEIVSHIKKDLNPGVKAKK